MRAPFQVLILPYRCTPAGLEFAVLERRDSSDWQFVSGGGEDDESPVEAAQREMREEVRLNVDGRLLKLDAIATIPACVFDEVASWGDDILVIPEYSFAVDVQDAELVLSSEHSELRWTSYEQACDLLRWDSNRTALWELRERLKRQLCEPCSD